MRHLRGRRRLVIGIVVLLYLVGCTGEKVVYLEPLPSPHEPRWRENKGWIEVFFTQPDLLSRSTFRGGPDASLAESIRRARFQVDLAVYRLDLWSVRDALLDAHNRGVKVRIVTEDSHLDQDEIQDLMEAGVPVISDHGQGLMHHKFVVIDQEEVWTGSMNFTLNGAYRHDNALLHVRSQEVAKNFTTEFEEMFIDGLFGENVRVDTPYPRVDIAGNVVETYFSPDDQPAERVVELIQNAEKSIIFLAFSFTSDAVAEAILKQAEHQVVVKGVMETSQSFTGKGDEGQRFSDSAVEIRFDGNPDKMHHKCIVIDDKVVITGSYNFTVSAEKRNDENILIIYDPQVARWFKEEFDRVFAMAHP